LQETFITELPAARSLAFSIYNRSRHAIHRQNLSSCFFISIAIMHTFQSS